MDFRILGPLEVEGDAGALDLGPPKQRTLLAMLLREPNKVVTADGLIDAIWAGRPPPTARKNLHVYVHRLRRLLGEGRIEWRGNGYLLAAAPHELDRDRFERLARAGRDALLAADHAGACSRLTEALSIWRGAPFGDLGGTPAMGDCVRRLEDRRLDVVEARADASLALERHGDVVAELEELVVTHPFRERLCAQYMRALWGLGRRADALEAYRRTRHVLARELGLEPGEELRRVEREILAAGPRNAPSRLGTGHAPVRAPARPGAGRARVPSPAGGGAEPERPSDRSRAADAPGGRPRDRRGAGDRKSGVPLPGRGVLALAVTVLLTFTMVSATPVTGRPESAPRAGDGTRDVQWVPGPVWVADPPKTVPGSLFGITVGSGSGAMPGFRMGSARLWDSRTRWANIQPDRRGRFSWTILDRLVAGAARSDLPVLYTMGMTPGWANPDGPRSAYTDDSRTAPPLDMADWDAYVRAVATRYRDRVDAYELWDYANSWHFFTGRLETLVEMVRRADRIIGAADPGATVVCPSMGDLWEPDARAAMSRFAMLGGYQTCDAAAVKLHPRDPRGSPEGMVDLARSIDNTLHSAGVHLPMWATGPSYATPTVRPFGQDQANDYAVRYFLVGLYARYERMYIYSWGPRTIPLVLQAEGGPPTQAALFIQELQKWLRNARVRSCGQGASDDLPPGVWQCRFLVPASDGGTEGAVIRWMRSGSRTVSVEAGAYRIQHLDGRSERVRSGERLRITERPILIRYRR